MFVSIHDSEKDFCPVQRERGAGKCLQSAFIAKAYSILTASNTTSPALSFAGLARSSATSFPGPAARAIAQAVSKGVSYLG